MPSLLLSTAYAPPILYFAYLYKYRGQAVYLEACESMPKQSYRNRCHILGANGVQALSLPVEHSEHKLTVGQVRLSAHDGWHRRHLQTIVSAYGSSPFFEYYWPDLQHFYQETYPTSLWDYTVGLTRTLGQLIELEIDLRPTERYAPEIGQVGDMRSAFHPKQPNIQLEALMPSYYQPFAHRHGFVPNLSVLDLVFNLGPESLLYLHRLSALLP